MTVNVRRHGCIVIVGALCVVLSFISFIMVSRYVMNNKKYGTVVIVNGPSAVGKSTLIRAFQAKMDQPWLSIGIDNFFIGVLPPKFYLEDRPEHHTIMRGIAIEDENGKLFTLHIGDEGQKVIKGMHQAIAAYAKEGNNVIVDYIMYDAAWRTDLMNALSGIPVVTVGITASLPVIEERERIRSTSPQGHARSVYYTVHAGWDYDLFIDTDAVMPHECADSIIEYMKKQKK